MIIYLFSQQHEYLLILSIFRVVKAFTRFLGYEQKYIYM
jgi:hypothetical protein